MRFAVACCAAIALAGCSSSERSLDVGKRPADTLPFDVGNGVGSELGNYGEKFDGEMRSPSGDRCFIFNWDRPLNKDFAIRYTSASCESKEHPNWMTTTTFSRKIIPMSESDLKDKGTDTDPSK
jgi:hypothetical protein